MQVLAEEAPTVAEYLPATQLVQVLDVLAPRVVEYVPMGHSWHALTANGVPNGVAAAAALTVVPDAGGATTVRDGYMAVGSILFLQEQIKDIIIIICGFARLYCIKNFTNF